MKKKIFVILGLLFFILLDAQGAFSRIGSDPSHMEVVATLSFENEPLSVAVNEVTGRVYIGDETGFFVIDSDTDEIVDYVSLDFGADFIAVNPVTNHMYVSGPQDGVAVTYVLDGVTYSVIGEIPHEDVWAYYGFALNPTTNRIYIPDRAGVMGEGDYVRVYDASNFSLLSSIEIPGSSGHRYIENLWVAINPQTNLLYATWAGNDSIYLIDCEANEILKTTPLSDVGPLIVNWATGNVYSDSVVLEGTSLEELLSFGPWDGHPLGVNPYDNLVIGDYGGSFGSSYLLILDGTSHEMLAALTLDLEIKSNSARVSFAVNTVTGKIYVIHEWDPKVSVIEERSGPQNHVVINEFELNPPGDDIMINGWVELYNPTPSDVDISGWYLNGEPSGQFLSIPQGAVIKSGGYYVVVATIGLPNEAAWIELKDSEYKAIDRTPMKSDLKDDDRTWQRSPDGCDQWLFQKTTPIVVADFRASLIAFGEVDNELGIVGPEPLMVHFIDMSTSGGEITSWEWDFDNDGTIDSTSQNPYHTYTSSGEYTISLTVTALTVNESDTETKDSYVVVTPVDQPQVADSGGPYTGEVGARIRFDGSGSYDPDGELVLYEWDLGDGTTKEGDKCYHIYQESGTYTVTLTVTDAVGNIDTDQTTVTVLPSEELPFWIIGIIFLVAVIIGTTVIAILLWRRRK